MSSTLSVTMLPFTASKKNGQRPFTEQRYARAMAVFIPEDTSSSDHRTNHRPGFSSLNVDSLPPPWSDFGLLGN